MSKSTGTGWIFTESAPRLEDVLVFGSLQTSPMCIVGELAGGGSVAVTVGVSDR